MKFRDYVQHVIVLTALIAVLICIYNSSVAAGAEPVASMQVSTDVGDLRVTTYVLGIKFEVKGNVIFVGEQDDQLLTSIKAGKDGRIIIHWAENTFEASSPVTIRDGKTILLTITSGKAAKATVKRDIIPLLESDNPADRLKGLELAEEKYSGKPLPARGFGRLWGRRSAPAPDPGPTPQ